MVTAMRRPMVALAAVLAAVGLFAGGLAWVLDSPRPAVGASRAERIYLAMCATCHGADGRGSWRATLFLIDPGDLTVTAGMGPGSDQYLFDIIKQGGSPLGRPGMPGFGYQLSDDDIKLLVQYLRTLGQRS
jgi:mono/diheme cytochrome c family protein